MSDAMIHIGSISGFHGLKGTLVVFSHSQPVEAIAYYDSWWLGNSPEHCTKFTVVRCWRHGKRVLAMLQGIESIADAEALQGQHIYIPYDDVAVADDEYLWHDLMGCEVWATQHTDTITQFLGEVRTLQSFGAQDTLVVENETGEWLIPFVEDVLLHIDVKQKRIDIRLLEGMDVCFTPKF